MSITPEIRNKVWEKTDGRCYYCGKQTLPFGNSKHSFCVDHIKPQIRNGGDELENLAPCCYECNSSKSSKGLFNWLNEKADPLTGNVPLSYFEEEKLPFDTAWNDEL